MSSWRTLSCVLTEAARLRRAVGPPEEIREERIDFAEFVSLALAATAANIGGIEELMAGVEELLGAAPDLGRPG